MVGITPHDKIYNTVTVIKTVWDFSSDRHIDQQNRMRKRETAPQEYSVPLNNTGLSCVDSLIHACFPKHTITVLQGHNSVESKDAEPRIWMANISLYVDF